MIVIADSGSTKCNWQLVDDSGSVRRVQSRGINAVLQRPDEVEALLRETFAEPVQADALHFYGAGCGERYPEQSARLREALARYFPAARIAVESDLMGAARALLGGRAGIACILGTGSNSCYYDGVRIVLGSGRRRKRDVHRPATRREPAERALRRIAAPALFRGGAARLR